MIRCFIFAIPDLDFPIFSNLNFFLDMIVLNLLLLNPSLNLSIVQYSWHGWVEDGISISEAILKSASLIQFKKCIPNVLVT